MVALAVLASAILGIAIAREADRTPAHTVALAASGAVNEMGMPVVATPGEASGVARVGDVEVDGANWALERVPLNVAVRPEWTLRNTGDRPVRLGDPHPEVLAGCCPGPVTIDRRIIDPGDAATLTFELSMHPGMDGWHEIDLHVPLGDETGSEVLTLGVTGDFVGTWVEP